MENHIEHFGQKMLDIFRTKSVDELRQTSNQETPFRRELQAWQLTLLDVGCIVGAGIFVLTGTAAAVYAGPAIALSFVVSALGCLCAALCYAELASMLPVAGSAYTYAYATWENSSPGSSAETCSWSMSLAVAR
jgi:APA family basic amino acid/polyamine antiporter